MTQNIEKVTETYPLTPTQQKMLAHMLLEPAGVLNAAQIRRNLEGPLDVLNLLLAWDIIVDRHPALRTTFLRAEPEAPLQVLHQKVAIPWEIQDWRDDLDGIEARLDQFAASYRETGFDLDQIPLLKMTLIQLGEQRHHFIWNFTHLLLDGWSSHQIFDEVLATYEQLIRKCKPDQPETRPIRSYNF